MSNSVEHAIRPRRLSFNRRALLGSLPMLLLAGLLAQRLHAVQFALIVVGAAGCLFAILGGYTRWARDTWLAASSGGAVLHTWGGPRVVWQPEGGRVVRVTVRAEQRLLWVDAAGGLLFVAKDGTWNVDRLVEWCTSIGVAIEDRRNDPTTKRRLRREFPTATRGPELPTVVVLVMVTVGIALSALAASLVGR
jgi:hypothetical protein